MRRVVEQTNSQRGYPAFVVETGNGFVRDKICFAARRHTTYESRQRNQKRRHALSNEGGPRAERTCGSGTFYLENHGLSVIYAAGDGGGRLNRTMAMTCRTVRINSVDIIYNGPDVGFVRQATSDTQAR